jgi:hypothetical protein
MHSSLFCRAAVFVGLLPAVTARAEINIGASLEWLTCSSEVVVLGRIEKVTATRGPGDVTYHDCQVKVSEVLSGKLKANAKDATKETLVFCYRTLGRDEDVKAWSASKEPLLLFLSPSKDHGNEKRLDGKLVPTNFQTPFSVIDLGNPPQDVFDLKFNVLTDAKKIVDTVRHAAKLQAEFSAKNPTAKLKSKNLEVPLESPAGKVLYAGSSCFLRAPDFGEK